MTCNGRKRSIPESDDGPSNRKLRGATRTGGVDGFAVAVAGGVA